MIGLIATIIGIYLLIAFAMYFLQEKLLFFPQPLDPQNQSLFAQHEISIESDGVTLNGWYVQGKISSTHPLIIYFGGNAEEVSGNLLMLSRIQTNSFLYVNYRGYGTNTGSPTEKYLFADSLRIYDTITKKYNISPEHIVLMGRSLGSGVAVYLASQRPVKGLILVTAYDSLANVAKSHYPFLPVKTLLKHHFNSLALAPDLNIPLLNLMASNDSVIPNRFSKNLEDHWSGPITSVLIEGADHNDISLYDEYWKAINRFLEKDAIPAQAGI